jgi:hypothetical protein
MKVQGYRNIWSAERIEIWIPCSLDSFYHERQAAMPSLMEGLPKKKPPISWHA